MALGEDLERIAGAASAHGEVTGVLAAEPARGPALLPRRARRGRGAALARARRRTARPIDARDDVRDTASIVAMCELAAELAGGGDLDELRAQLAQVRMVEQPPGIEEAEEAALALERVIGAPPRVASPAYLDEVGRRRARARAVARGGGVAVRERDPVGRGRRRAVRAGSRARLPATTSANVGAWKVEFGASRSAAIPRISYVGCASSPSSRPSRCRRRSASSSRR